MDGVNWQSKNIGEDEGVERLACDGLERIEGFGVVHVDGKECDVEVDDQHK